MTEPGKPDSDGKLRGTLLTRHWPLILITTAVAVGVSLAATAFTWNTKWEAHTQVRIGRSAALSDSFTDPAYVERILNTIKQVASGDLLINAARRQVNASSPKGEDNSSTVSVSVERETELLRIGAADTHAAEARKMLQAMLGQTGIELRRIYGQDVAYTPIDPNGEITELHPPFLLHGFVAGAVGFLLGLGIGSLIDRRRGSTQNRG